MACQDLAVQARPVISNAYRPSPHLPNTDLRSLSPPGGMRPKMSDIPSLSMAVCMRSFPGPQRLTIFLPSDSSEVSALGEDARNNKSRPVDQAAFVGSRLRGTAKNCSTCGRHSIPLELFSSGIRDWDGWVGIWRLFSSPFLPTVQCPPAVIISMHREGSLNCCRG